MIGTVKQTTAESKYGKGTAIILAGNPDDTNSIDDPRRVTPTTTTVKGVKPSFTYTMPAYSVVVLKLKAPLTK